jgi:hypothetical protein
MREIVNPQTKELYMRVEVKNGRLRMQCVKGSAADLWFELDAKVIPHLYPLLKEAEFFKCL